MASCRASLESIPRSSMFSFTISSKACCEIVRPDFGGPIYLSRRRRSVLQNSDRCVWAKENSTECGRYLGLKISKMDEWFQNGLLAGPYSGESPVQSTQQHCFRGRGRRSGNQGRLLALWLASDCLRDRIRRRKLDWHWLMGWCGLCTTILWTCCPADFSTRIQWKWGHMEDTWRQLRAVIVIGLIQGQFNAILAVREQDF